jgi:predicted DsbA family dithiol-disulfide isomerase
MLLVYGDFNCPYSALASRRVDELLRIGAAEIEWRAVEHEPELPPEGRPVEGEFLKKLRGELDEIAELLRPGEDFAPELPEIYPNTRDVSQVFSTWEDEAAHFYRRQAFDALWLGGRNISDVSVLGETGVGQREPLADAWQRKWEDIERRIVPLLVIDDEIVRGKDVLERLGLLLDEAVPHSA